ncbi:putative DNA hydrolase [Streptomyces sp. Tu6071]|nr:putative DNA hydrolase [Streptomyces sp. Tu6071]
MKIPGIEHHAPDRLVDPSEFADREFRGTESSGERGILDLRAGALDPVGENARVVEGERQQLLVVPPRVLPQKPLDRRPSGTAGVTARRGRGKVGGEREVGHAHHSHSGIAAGVAVGGELFQVRAMPCPVGAALALTVVSAQAGLLLQLPPRRSRQILPGTDKTSRQGPLPLVRGLPAADEERPQPVVPHREHDQIDGDSEGREVGGVVGSHATDHSRPPDDKHVVR